MSVQTQYVNRYAQIYQELLIVVATMDIHQMEHIVMVSKVFKKGHD